MLKNFCSGTALKLILGVRGANRVHAEKMLIGGTQVQVTRVPLFSSSLQNIVNLLAYAVIQSFWLVFLHDRDCLFLQMFAQSLAALH